MFGGILSTTNILIIEDQDLLIASFSHQLYEFSIKQAIITNIRTHHQHLIIHLHYDEANSIVRSVDQIGTIVAYSVSKNRKVNSLDTKKKVFARKERIKQSRIRVYENEVEIYGLTQSGRLLRYSNGIIGTIVDQCCKLLYLSDEYLITLQQINIINIINPANIQIKKIYQHTSQVTSVQVYQNNLIVGDQKGKINILVGFLQSGQIKIRQKLQWHVHEVSALRINGAYLYSAGEEGVVVMWHLRENVKDFLPRIGSQIDNLIVAESKIYCLLRDNTIKSIDFNNDKAVSHFKVVVNPRLLKISAQSQKLVERHLVRVSKLEDKIYLRSVAGKIQEINLHSATNIEYNIVNRNIVSRLDNNLPTPHQITDICFSKDGNHLGVVLQGINCRSLKFYQYDREDFNLVSKVQNCHSGHSRVNLLSLADNKFISYASDDSRIKVWKLSVRRKQSIVQIEQYFWCCDYQITFREMLPRHVSFDSNRIIITLERQFIIFNVSSKIVESVFGRQVKGETVVAVHGLNDVHHSILVFYQNKIDLVQSLKEISTILKLSHQTRINADGIVINKNGEIFALLIKQSGVSHLYVYALNHNVNHYQIPNLGQRQLTDIFWIGQRLMALDSSLFFYDITHGKPLVALSSRQPENQTEMEVQQQGQTAIVLDYQSVCKRYLQKQFRVDKQSVQKITEMLGVSPSISGCFSLLAQGLLI